MNKQVINKSGFAYLCEYIFLKDDNGKLIKDAHLPEKDIKNVFDIDRIGSALTQRAGASNPKYTNYIDNLIKQCAKVAL